MSCQHYNLKYSVKVVRLQNENDTNQVNGFRADISIGCVDCGSFFEFLGPMETGFSIKHPTIDQDRLEIHLPIVPSNTKR